MTLIVQKFGGSSLSDAERIKAVAASVSKEVAKGNKIVVVVSAMQGVTNNLISQVESVIIPLTQAQMHEYDAVVSVGEHISAGLLALALMKSGVAARSIQAWQLPIVVDDPLKQNITDIDVALIKECLAKGITPVITGFQGISNGKVATLGRGGSDTTAVALAHYLNAERCDILTDVDGIYTADPRIVRNAQFIKQISYREMQAMAECGAKILNANAAEIARKYKVNLRIASSFHETVGTKICDDTISNNIKGITSVTNQVAFNIRTEAISLEDIQVHLQNNGVITKLVKSLAQELILVAEESLSKAKNALESLANIEIQISDWNELAIVSVISDGIEDNDSLQQFLLQCMQEKGIKFVAHFFDECKFSIVMAMEYHELALRFLHQAIDFNDEDNINRVFNYEERKSKKSI